jgi:hypothetical protein
MFSVRNQAVVAVESVMKSFFFTVIRNGHVLLTASYLQ